MSKLFDYVQIAYVIALGNLWDLPLPVTLSPQLFLESTSFRLLRERLDTLRVRICFLFALQHVLRPLLLHLEQQSLWQASLVSLHFDYGVIRWLSVSFYRAVAWEPGRWELHGLAHRGDGGRRSLWVDLGSEFMHTVELLFLTLWEQDSVYACYLQTFDNSKNSNTWICNQLLHVHRPLAL